MLASFKFWVCCVVQSEAFEIAREGFVLLQFAPAAGVRQYDLSKKQVSAKCIFFLLQI